MFLYIDLLENKGGREGVGVAGTSDYLGKEEGSKRKEWRKD